MLQFYTEPSTEGLHIVRSIPGLMGLKPKRLAVPTAVRDRHVFSNFEADEQWTGPADFDQMHENVHYKFSSDQPIFGSASNWSTWVGESFAGYVRRFDAPTSSDGNILFITPDLGGFNTISVAMDNWQYRIAGDLRWVVRDCLVEERYLLVIADYQPFHQGATVTMIRRYMACQDGHISECSNRYSQSWYVPGAIGTFMDTSAPVLLDRWCPVTGAMDEYAAQQKQAFADTKWGYEETRKIRLGDAESAVAASQVSLDALYGRLKQAKSTIKSEKAAKQSLRQQLLDLRRVRDEVRVKRDQLNKEISSWKTLRDRQFALHGATAFRDLSPDSRSIVNMASENLKSLRQRRDDAKSRLSSLRERCDEVYAEIARRKELIAQLYEAKSSLYTEIESAKEARATLWEARDEIYFQPKLPNGWWDTASVDFTWYTQPSQVALDYLSSVAAFRESHKEAIKKDPELMKRYTKSLKTEMVRPLIEYRARYDEWLAQNPVSRVDRGEAVMRAVKDTKYIDINSIAFMKEMPELFGEIKALYEVFRNPLHPAAWAGLVLSYSYGMKLTVADTGELLEGIHRKIQQASWLRSWNKVQGGVASQPDFPYDDAEFPLHRTVNANVYYGECDDRLSRALLEIDNWDVLPTFSNVWDLIPYSFVVDWFVNVGTILEDMDTMWKALELPVLCYFSTTTDSVDVPHRYIREICPYGQTVRFSHYERRKRDQLDLFMHKLEFSAMPTEVIPQASSLIVQRLDKI